MTSCDPIYRWDTPQIQSRIAATYDQILAQTRLNADEFVWDHFPTPEAMGAARMAAMTTFLADYETGRRDGRYVDAELPSLPFDDGAFDLAVSSHFLFLYSAQDAQVFPSEHRDRMHDRMKSICRGGAGQGMAQHVGTQCRSDPR